MSDSDRNPGGIQSDRLASWYRRLEQAAEELRRKEAERREAVEGAQGAMPAPAASAPQAHAPSQQAAASPAARPVPAPAPGPLPSVQPPPAAPRVSPRATPQAAPLRTAPPASSPRATPAVATPAATPPPRQAGAVPVLPEFTPPAMPTVPEFVPPGTRRPEAAAQPAAPAPASAAKEKRRPSRRAVRKAAPDGVAAGPGADETAALLGVDASVVERLPPAVRALLVVPERDTAQHYYTKPFGETRTELIRRLLDPPLTLEETARILNVCPMTVRRYTNRGVLPHFRTAGDQRRFRLSDVLSFLERQGRIPEPADEDAS